MKTIEELRDYLSDRLPGTRIWLFGSRARGEAAEGSDIDIAVECDGSGCEILSLLRMEIEESNLPWKVDLVDLDRAPWLRERVEKEGIRWL